MRARTPPAATVRANRAEHETAKRGSISTRREVATHSTKNIDALGSLAFAATFSLNEDGTLAQPTTPRAAPPSLDAGAETTPVTGLEHLLVARCNRPVAPDPVTDAVRS